MDQDRAGELLVALMTRYVVPGAQLGLLRSTDRVVICAGVTADGNSEPVVPATRFHVGSIAKSLAALLIVHAARSGLVDLDAPCDQQAKGLWPDTPRAIMAQTTGRQNVLPDIDEDLDGFVARVLAMPPVHRPGRFSYCNSGWSVLDLLLRRRTGMSFEELAMTTVLGPDADFGMPIHDIAAGHSVGPDRVLHPVPSVYAAAASAAGSRWWSSADQMLDYAQLHLSGGAGRFDPADVALLRQPHADVPGATISDSWGLGWALWNRGDHHAFGWAGFTGGHRACLRCFPDQHAAVVLLANSAGSLFREPGGSALFDAILPDVLDLLDVAPIPDPAYREPPTSVEQLAGAYGPLRVEAVNGSLLLHAAAFGEADPLFYTRLGGNSFAPPQQPPGHAVIAFDDSLMYLAPFAIPRN